MTKRLSLLSLLILSVLIGSAQSFSPMTSILNGTSSSGVPCVVDMNGDHLDDVVRFQNTNLIIDYQQADGTFIMASYPAGIDNYPTWSAAAGDIDGNGYNDFILGSGSEISFVYANSNGTGYNEVNISDYVFSQRTNLADIDNDGNLDAFACHDVDESHPYRNDGNGNLSEDQSLIATVPLAGNYASVWVDFDNDGDTDMYLSKCRQGSSAGAVERENALYVNDGSGNYTEEALDYGLFDNEQSWVTIFEDFDNDGDFDSYTVNHTGTNRLKENDGTGHYTNVTPGSGIDANDLDSWACIGADFDNDGYVDILSESNVGKQFYHNDGGLQFTAMGMSFDDGALGDLNNDGFIDVYTGSTLFMNNGNDNNWIKFALEGIVSNVNGIGSRVEIYGDWGVQIRECRSGQSFQPASTLNVHFGLSTFSSIDSVVVTWPSGIVSVLQSPDINQLVVIPEGECFFEAEDIEISGPTEICPGESVTMTAPDGYDYLWSNGSTNQSITASSTGNYSVNLTDESECIALSNNVSVQIIVDESPSITASQDPLICAGESITLSASEGNSYLWSTGEESQSISVTTPGPYSVAVEGTCITTESEELVIQVNDPEEPITLDVEFSEAGTYELSAEGENLTWYEDYLSSVILATGNTYQANVPAEGLTVYVGSSIEYGISGAGGKPNNTGGGGLPSTGAFSFFNAYEPFRLDSVTVYTVGGNTGEREFQLVDGNGTIIEEGIFDINISGMNVVHLGWDVPAGNGLSLRCTENNLFRNNDGVNYPYNIGDVGQLYNSPFGTQYYYYFYDWKYSIGQLSCESDRVPLNVSIVTGLEESAGLEEFNIYPNPVNDIMTLELRSSNAQTIKLEISDAMGRVVFQEDLGAAITVLNKSIDLSELSSGTYTLTLTTEEGILNEQMVVE